MMFNDEMIYKIRNKKYAIIKISDINAIKNMIYNGQIWLRHPVYFQKEFCEKQDDTRGDNLDTIWYIHIVGDNKFGGKTILDKYRSDDSYRVICFYMLEINGKGFFQTPDERMRRFGEFFTFVNANKIYSILNDKIEKNAQNSTCDDYGVWMGSIAYVTEKKSCLATSFTKRECYSYQNELRISVNLLENVKTVIEDEDICQINEKLLTLLNEQESLAKEYRASHEEQLLLKTIEKNKDYEETYKKYSCLKSSKEQFIMKEDGFDNCFLGCYPIDELYQQGKSIYDFKEIDINE